MIQLARSEMIENLRRAYRGWELFHSSVVGDQYIDVVRKVDGWFVCFEGFDVTDMYLQSEDPRGDAIGDVITCKDVFGSLGDDDER